MLYSPIEFKLPIRRETWPKVNGRRSFTGKKSLRRECGISQTSGFVTRKTGSTPALTSTLNLCPWVVICFGNTLSPFSLIACERLTVTITTISSSFAGTSLWRKAVPCTRNIQIVICRRKERSGFLTRLPTTTSVLIFGGQESGLVGEHFAQPPFFAEVVSGEEPTKISVKKS